MIVLGIETTCDETAVAVIDHSGQVRAQVLRSQVEHQPWGGVVPEVAARAHLDYLVPIMIDALAQSHLTKADIDVIAVAGGPGLIGGLLVGLTTAKTLAVIWDKPLVVVNHLVGHALSPRIGQRCPFPYLLLLASGGHCLLAAVKGARDMQTLGSTLDDAPGETFDKIARLLDLPYPGGAKIEELAVQGESKRFALPQPMRGKAGCDFSFSGLKTAASRLIAKYPNPSLRVKADISAALQQAIGDIFYERSHQALRAWPGRLPGVYVFAGGVAANVYLRRRVGDFAKAEGMQEVFPDQTLCTDNAVMIAWAGLEQFQAGYTSALNFKARPRWPLDVLG